MNNKTVLDKSSPQIEDTKAREAWNSYFVFSKECNRTRDLLLKRVYAGNTGTQPLLTLHRFKSNRQPSRDPPGFLAPTISPQPPLSLRAFPSLPKTRFPVKQQHGTHTRPFPKRHYKRKASRLGIFSSVYISGVPFGPTFQSQSSGCINCPWVLDVTPSPWEANRDFWFPPHECSASCAEGEWLENIIQKQPSPDEAARRWYSYRDFCWPEQTRGAGLGVSTKSPAAA